ncbi:hypothetical protein [Methanochimaera problematica]|uniref:hypothetical protein n=1 Tax=Methanochimaera problematica TaxID=2609417 RepID=UPI00293945B3|nr:hypothetical protein [Methanoplanus sp. FWC-SCC4]
MGEKDWKTEYKYLGTRVAKGLGSTPEEANKAAREQLTEKNIIRRKKNGMEKSVMESA